MTLSCSASSLFWEISKKTWSGRAKLGKRLCGVDCSLDSGSMQPSMASFKANSMCVFLLQITVSSSLSFLWFPPLLSLRPTHSSRLKLRELSPTTSSLIVRLREKHTSSVVSGWQIMTLVEKRSNKRSKKKENEKQLKQLRNYEALWTIWLVVKVHISLNEPGFHTIKRMRCRDIKKKRQQTRE